MNFVFISPNFPEVYSHFVKSLKERGLNVLGIGDTFYENLNEELKENLTEYCYVSDMSNLQWMKNTVDYLENKYGHIDYIESNNEYWLENDAQLREYKNVQNGFYPHEMEKIKCKSKMKGFFKKAGVKVARYTLAYSLENVLKFVYEVGYPIFAKPDNGVGASHTCKINNKKELISFFENKDDQLYIIEEYINGEIVSFDGIADDNSNVAVSFKETFPIPIAEMVNNDLDDYYYANCDIDEAFEEMGKSVIKAFGIKKRCFHIEFFRLKEDRPGLAKKGEIIGLEVNMRPPGGNTPDLLSISLNESFYSIYGDIIAFNKVNINLNKKHYIAISVSRKNRFEYIYNNDQVFDKYGKEIIDHGYYPDAIADALGNEYYMAKFISEKKAIEFAEYIRNKKQ